MNFAFRLLINFSFFTCYGHFTNPAQNHYPQTTLFQQRYVAPYFVKVKAYNTLLSKHSISRVLAVSKELTKLKLHMKSLNGFQKDGFITRAALFQSSYFNVFINIFVDASVLFLFNRLLIYAVIKTAKAVTEPFFSQIFEK